MRFRLLTGLLALCVGACADPPIRSRVGEIHLHQYPTGAHLGVLFVDPPTPIAQTELDSALPRTSDPVLTVTAAQSTCKAFIYKSCGNGCTSPEVIDGGPVVIEGLPRAVDLRWDPVLRGYGDLVTDGLVVPGGLTTTTRAAGGGLIPPFEGRVHTAMPIEPSTTLDAGLGAGLEIGWTDSGAGDDVKILVSALPTSGPSGVVVCTLPESATRFRVPDEALALLPPPPRQLQLEVSRFRLVDVSLGDGRGVVLHSSYSVLSATAEP